MWFVGQVPGCGQHVAHLVVVGEVVCPCSGFSGLNIVRVLTSICYSHSSLVCVRKLECSFSPSYHSPSTCQSLS